ncbi:MAG: haloalkane dehalogenase [Bacteroidetes bacterium]|nr:haloalkane dehalogenase [Bacteroidota bacterium]
MKILRTPDERFQNLPGFPFDPNYVELNDGLRMHYLDEGPTDGEVVLLLHGEPSWSYLYRKMIPGIVEAGYRVIAADLIGFGRSDKPTEQSDYTYQFHVDWMKEFLQRTGLKNITLFCQDWGGLIGLRILAEESHLFKRVIAANTILPSGDTPPNQPFLDWQLFSQKSPKFDVGTVLQKATVSHLTDDVVAAYNAPFPDDSYKAGARIFPTLVPTRPDDPAAAPNRKAWASLMKLNIPFLTAFSDSDPIMRGLDKVFHKMIPGTKGQAHTTIEAGGHFLQEDKGEELAGIVVEFMKANP